ncbi:hypothetical protein VN12_16005 [Pirellula sp. SH-Sr6A]|uniref:DUF58 domain-containing protein n=1 Tax=Pirellula sp. SH-Sr6A TaxID=1632865 RepID=UPI00078EE786|nr:DUF58 domain-containing protein [Pirellula sp. SH-Sr6A]AMV33632.1 hypothetical protein VN12_16005 [Pirellula sp. SH-Sr6A]
MDSASRTSAPLLTPELMSKLERMELVSRKIFRGRMKGERRSKRKGQSVEFADFRNYSSGDDLRFIDWNLYARLDRLYLKLFLEEEDLHFYAILDDSLSMGFGDPSKLHVGKQIAASLGYIGLCRGDRVSVSGFASAGTPVVLRGKSNSHRLMGALEAIECGSGGVEMQDAIKRFCLRNSGKGIAVVISDLMSKAGYESALRMLVARGMDVFMVHILSPEELEPKLVGDLKLVDCEDGDVRELSISTPILQRYQQTLNAFVDQAKTFCNRLSITYVPARSDRAADQLVNEYLRARGLVR